MSGSKFLMCAPDHFRVAYEINPWMSLRRQPDVALAQKQWKCFYELLTQKLKVTVELIPPVPLLPDMVFTANAGMARRKLFIPSNFRHPERAKEEVPFTQWFRARGYEIQMIEKPYYFEGEGDALSMGDELYTGYHFRSDVQSHDLVSGILKQSYFALELKDKRFYHLDTCFAPVSPNTALVFLDAFATYAQLVILENIADPIRVSEEEALRFACNAVVVEKDIVIPSGCPKVTAELEQRGFTVHATDFSEFMKAGGAAKCLVLSLDQPGTMAAEKPKLRN
ncbi:MAG: amidinotransferase [Candidatus Omnitrophica bacterium]|nr:amidinotransferase [Candidatus Omnitrophota bacterium]